MSDPTLGAAIDGPHVHLRNVLPGDYPALHIAATTPPAHDTWRYYSASVSFEEFCRHLWDGVLAQFLACERSTGHPVALVQAVGASFRHGTCNVNLLGLPSYIGTPLVSEGLFLFVEYLFSRFPLRKLYSEVLDPTFGRVASGKIRTFNIEAQLSEHEWHRGGLVDTNILSLSRESWRMSDLRQRLFRIHHAEP